MSVKLIVSVILGPFPVSAVFLTSIATAAPGFSSVSLKSPSINKFSGEQPGQGVNSSSPEQAAAALNEQGVGQMLRGDTEKAIVTFEQGLALNTSKYNPTLHYNIAGAYLKQGEIQRAVEHARKAVALKPNELSLLHRQGEAELAAKNYADAARLFAKIAAYNPEFNESVLYLATAYAMQGNWPEAEKTFRRAREIYPTHRSVDLNFANVLIVQNNFEEALNVLEKVVKNYPSADAYYALGVAAQGVGDNKKAKVAYQIARSLGAKSLDLEARISDVDRQLGQ